MKKVPLLHILAFMIVAITALSCALYRQDLTQSQARLREDTNHRNDQRALQLSDAVKQQVESLVQGFDLATRQLRDAYLGDAQTFDHAVRNVLSNYPDGAIRLILVFDEKGYLSYSSDGSKDRVYFGDREHFRVHADSKDDRLFIGKPVFGRIGKSWVILFTRPIRRDGKFAGVVVVSLRPDYLSSALSSLNVNPGDIVALHKADGAFLARSVRSDEVMGKSAVPERPFVDAEPGAHGLYRASSTVDGLPRVYGWQRLADFPLVALVGLDETAELAVLNREFATSRQRAGMAILVLMMFSLGVGGLLISVERQQGKVRDSERQAAKDAARFQLLLRTASDGIHVCDSQGYLCEASESFLRMLGYSAEEARGLHIRDFDAHFDADTLAKMLPELIRSPRVFESKHRRVDGTLIDVEISTRGVQLDGTPYIYASSRDITLRKQGELERKRAEAALRATSARLKLVLETAAEGIFGIDDEGRVMFANPSAAQTLGWPSPEAMLGKRTSEVLGHRLDDGSPCEQGFCSIRETQKDGQIRRVANECFLTAAGMPRPVEYVVSPLWVEGCIIGVTVVFHDVTERMEAEREIRELLAFRRAVVDSAGHAVIAIDREGTVVLFNPAAERLLGYQAEEVVGKVKAPFFHDPDDLREKVEKLLGEDAAADPFVRIVAYLDAGVVPLENEFLFLRKDGSTVPVQMALSALRDEGGRSNGYIGIGQDVSLARGMERELKRSNAELERFAYVASHDLRQPLRMIASYLTLLERRLAGKLDQSEQEFFDFAVDGAKRMDKMIVDLLDYSRIGRATDPMGEVSLDAMLARALSNLGVAIEDANAEVVVTAPLPTLQGSETEMERLFQNLIGNAIKFHAVGRPPKVTIHCHETPRQWILSVTDNGIGVDPKDHERLFHVFQRLVSRESYEGTGIGLAACRKIVEHHGGKIWLESALGSGSTFHVALPK